ncbi:MAG: flagellar export chaperone FliS [Burkholderiaceae bacterium]|nr:flagellar export chaperone FliS [Burkholderiaceae bacterium]
MYGSPSPFASGLNRANAMYAQVGVQTSVQEASPHRLVALLFEGLVEAMGQAILAIEVKNTAVKNRALMRAVRILDEGLKAALNMESGVIARDLNNLYAYMCLRLTQANLNSDISAIEECQRLVKPIREAWLEIGDQVKSGAAGV